jgi:hypothetical protein
MPGRIARTDQAAARERIVAFVRPGKLSRRPGSSRILREVATLSKACGASNGRLKEQREMAAAPKKREARKSVRQSGWITLDGGFAARPCTVLDLSSAGAKITVDDPQAVPAKVRLAFSRDARTGRVCEVVWRRGKTLGVKFVR